jgi:hypothetical protein
MSRKKARKAGSAAALASDKKDFARSTPNPREGTKKPFSWDEKGFFTDEKG